MTKAKDHTGLKINGRTCVGKADHRDPSGHVLWIIRCDNCGYESKRTTSSISYWIREKPGCQKCNHGGAASVPIGTRCQLLISTGPCQPDLEKPGQRRVPAKCTECGKTGFFRKANFNRGTANCTCATQTLEGQHSTPEGTMLSSAKVRAKKKGLECTIKIKDIKIPKRCPVLGIELVPGATREELPNAPSLDRIDSTKGYTPENIWVISHRANRLKSDATIQELELVVKALRKLSRGQLRGSQSN